MYAPSYKWIKTNLLVRPQSSTYAVAGCFSYVRNEGGLKKRQNNRAACNLQAARFLLTDLFPVVNAKDVALLQIPGQEPVIELPDTLTEFVNITFSVGILL